MGLFGCSKSVDVDDERAMQRAARLPLRKRIGRSLVRRRSEKVLSADLVSSPALWEYLERMLEARLLASWHREEHSFTVDLYWQTTSNTFKP